MSSMTKDQMRSALISHGVTEPDLPPQSAKKEVWVALYEERIMPITNGAAEFSSDDELSPTKRASKTSKVFNASKSSKSPKKSLVEDSMTVDGVDISALDDDELFQKLKESGVDAGPIVGSTRKFYQRKLVLMLKGETAPTTNGNGVEYSDEEEEEEDDQPAAVMTPIEPSVSTRRSATAKKSNSTEKKSPAPAKSPIGSMLKETIGVRHRGGQDSLDAGQGKLTPTPRRSIHSFKVSETSKQLIGETRDIKQRTEIKGRVVCSESSGGCVKYLIKLLKVSAVLAVLAALYFAFIYVNEEVNSFEQIIDAVNTAKAEDEAPPAANIYK